MAAPAPFRFDLELDKTEADEESRAPAEPTIALSEHQALVAAAEAHGRAAGLAEGRASAEAKAAEALAAAMRDVGAKLSAFLSKADGELSTHRRQATDLAIAAAGQLAHRLVSREPLAEIEAVISECLGPLRRTPHLVVRLRAEHADALKARIGAMADERGFSGRLVILGEPDFAPGDCRIEWADGGIVRNMAAALAAIEETVAAYGAADDTPGEG